jgi:ABC-type methionine transport system ATPase subunit
VSTAKLHLTFPDHLISEPVIHRMGRDFELVTNIRRANIEDRGGWVILEVEGDDASIGRAVTWLVEQGLQVEHIEGD